MPHRLLLADDHGGLRRRVRSLLETAGFEVCGEAINGSDAIAKTKALLPDLIILNLSMPVMNGLDAIPEIMKRSPGVKIVVFSVDEADELRREALRRGAHGYVCKSSPAADLINEVTKLLGGE
jgi:DNA-binding NarL/FixJ family response regulator